MITDRERSYVALASAVLNRAFHDLVGRYEKHASDIRREAYHFLTAELWEEDCLWTRILGGRISRERVLSKVRAKCRVRANGYIEVI